MVTVACVLWGDKFDEQYVHNLKSAVQRNTTIEHRFVCFSDRQIEGVDTILLNPGLNGWWNKLQMFDGRIKGRVVYLDLDTLVVDNIDWLLNYEGIFAGIEDLGSVNSHQPHLKNKLQSGVLAWNADYMSWIHLEFILQKDDITSRFRGDGEYLNSIIKHRDLLQHLYPNEIKSYKYQVYPDKIDGASIVCFHGRPSIVQSLSQTITTPTNTFEPQLWVKDHWR